MGMTVQVEQTATLPVLRPSDVARECSVTVREAYKMMRSAGAVAAGRNGHSLRITREKFYRWLDNAKRS
jgi:hypothetical protein